MKKLDFYSDLLTHTDRYSKDFSLPDYIYDENGNFDRRATIDLLLSEEYGYVDADGVELTVSVIKERENELFAGKCKKHIKFDFCLCKNGDKASFPVDLFLPNTDGICPLVVNIDFRLDGETCYCPMEEVIEQKVALARVLYGDITTDDGDFENGIARLVTDRSKPRCAGKIAIWAYAVSLIGEYMLDNGYAVKEKLYAAGHSRLGKTVLLAAALDERFAGVHSNNSGCSGVSVSREKQGETAGLIYKRFPHWFTPEFEKYDEKEDEMPFDQHYLTALIAPRKLSVATAEEDTWADTEAQYISLEAASVIYEKYGAVGLDRSQGLMKTGMSSSNGQIGLTMRKGSHYFSRDDWNFFIKFISQ